MSFCYVLQIMLEGSLAKAALKVVSFQSLEAIKHIVRLSDPLRLNSSSASSSFITFGGYLNSLCLIHHLGIRMCCNNTYLLVLL